VLSVDSFREVIAPLSGAIGQRVAGFFGISEDLAQRLERVHSEMTVTDFRVRQIAWSFFGVVAGSIAATVLSPPAAMVALLIVGSPILVFLIIEQRLAIESQRWQRRIFLELPVISEQIGMLISAGYSLNGALSRIASRTNGACSEDLVRVVARSHQGISNVDALREWATLADVPSLYRLVSILALNDDAADLGRLIAEEARSIRRDVQRETVEQIERRNQQVWIPVTVAALVPGVILMAIPFMDAMSLFSES
jgi:tight adherence protein C